MIHRWVPLRVANERVAAWHSYLPAARGCIYSLGAYDGDQCVGVVVVGRPVARALDDGRHAEVIRLVTNGRPNAASFLLGHARRVAQSMGFAMPLGSYIREGEPGTCYTAAGWTADDRAVRAESWRRGSRPARADVLAGTRKRRVTR